MTKVSDHYDAVAEGYGERYEREKLLEGERYPANYFRMQLMLTSFLGRGIKRVIEIGVGEGTPLATLAKAGVEVWGVDISEKMAHKCRERIEALGQSPDQ
ncbi:MAG: class I SAM-dependent methyltransferase, partial [Deltaproteobacteria bacterium]|nr:class I SAM-dependent methyltransferase [Deltaproteobacteria bacterium]